MAYNRIYKEVETEKDMGKKAQVTIFIIVGIILVVAILILYLWIGPSYLFTPAGSLDFDSCVREAVGDAIWELEAKAGFINPGFVYDYQGNKLTYLCYTNQYYETCAVQVPFLKQSFDGQMEILIRDKISTCYDNSINELKSEGYDVVSGNVEFNLEIEPSIVRVEIEAPTAVGSQSVSRFNIATESPLYEMLMIATSIVQFESSYGDSDITSLMGYYPDYIIDKVKQGDGTTVYILRHKDYGDKFQFASRSLVLPAGYGGT